MAPAGQWAALPAITVRTARKPAAAGSQLTRITAEPPQASCWRRWLTAITAENTSRPAGCSQQETNQLEVQAIDGQADRARLKTWWRSALTFIVQGRIMRERLDS